MTFKIDTISARSKLDIRREPYWYKIDRGLRIGFRKMTPGADGAWQLRYRDESGNERQLSLGTLEQHPPHDRFNQAVAAARQWCAQTPEHLSATTAQRVTVLDACTAFVKRVTELRGEKAGGEMARRYRRMFANDTIQTMEVAKLSREMVHGFRCRLVAEPVRFDQGRKTRERSKNTVNRDMAALRAALNRALADQLVKSDFAWREPLKDFKNAGKRRNLYLDREQRRRLVNEADEDLGKFLWGLSILPLRPGALAALTVGDYDARLGVLRIGMDKGGHERTIMLPSQIAATLTKEAGTRAPSAPLLTRADGLAWNKDAWKDRIKEAAAKAELPPQTTAYTLRHSVITDLVHGGLDLLTVAQISGTSVAMIEKHYGHLRGTIAAVALAKLAL